MIKKILVFLIGINVLQVQAQSFDQAKLDSLFNAMEMKKEAMGGISIYQDGKEVYQKSFGYADISNNIKANKETKYRVGSITKTFTATIIMQLVEEGKLKLDTPLSRYFPQIPNAEKITIELLLRHRSGLFNVTNDDDLRSWIVNAQTRQQMLDRFVKNGTISEPDEKAEYANTNYILLSYIAEEIEKKTYAQILDARIITPLKLKRTAYGKVIDPKENEALSYYKEAAKWNLITMQTHLDNPIGAGAIVSTPTELNTFFNNLFTHQFVEEKTLAKMQTIQEGMGIGLNKFFFAGKEALGHPGGIDGFQSIALYFPKEKTSISFVVNALEKPMIATLVAVAEAYFGKDPKAQNETSYEISEAELDPYLGTYSSDQMPVKVIFTKKGNVLSAQVTGQDPFTLVALEKDIFRFDGLMISFKFDRDNNTVAVDQKGGRKFSLRKE